VVIATTVRRVDIELRPLRVCRHHTAQWREFGVPQPARHPEASPLPQEPAAATSHARILHTYIT